MLSYQEPLQFRRAVQNDPKFYFDYPLAVNANMRAAANRYFNPEETNGLQTLAANTGAYIGVLTLLGAVFLTPPMGLSMALYSSLTLGGSLGAGVLSGLRDYMNMGRISSAIRSYTDGYLAGLALVGMANLGLYALHALTTIPAIASSAGLMSGLSVGAMALPFIPVAVLGGGLLADLKYPGALNAVMKIAMQEVMGNMVALSSALLAEPLLQSTRALKAIGRTIGLVEPAVEKQVEQDFHFEESSLSMNARMNNRIPGLDFSLRSSSSHSQVLNEQPAEKTVLGPVYNLQPQHQEEPDIAPGGASLKF